MNLVTLDGDTIDTEEQAQPEAAPPQQEDGRGALADMGIQAIGVIPKTSGSVANLVSSVVTYGNYIFKGISAAAAGAGTLAGGGSMDDAVQQGKEAFNDASIPKAAAIAERFSDADKFLKSLVPAPQTLPGKGMAIAADTADLVANVYIASVATAGLGGVAEAAGLGGVAESAGLGLKGVKALETFGVAHVLAIEHANQYYENAISKGETPWEAAEDYTKSLAIGTLGNIPMAPRFTYILDKFGSSWGAAELTRKLVHSGTAAAMGAVSTAVQQGLIDTDTKGLYDELLKSANVSSLAPMFLASMLTGGTFLSPQEYNAMQLHESMIQQTAGAKPGETAQFEHEGSLYEATMDEKGIPQKPVLVDEKNLFAYLDDPIAWTASVKSAKRMYVKGVEEDVTGPDGKVIGTRTPLVPIADDINMVDVIPDAGGGPSNVKVYLRDGAVLDVDPMEIMGVDIPMEVVTDNGIEVGFRNVAVKNLQTKQAIKSLFSAYYRGQQVLQQYDPNYTGDLVGEKVNQMVAFANKVETVPAISDSEKAFMLSNTYDAVQTFAKAVREGKNPELPLDQQKTKRVTRSKLLDDLGAKVGQDIIPAGTGEGIKLFMPDITKEDTGGRILTIGKDDSVSVFDDGQSNYLLKLKRDDGSEEIIHPNALIGMSIPSPKTGKPKNVVFYAPASSRGANRSKNKAALKDAIDSVNSSSVPVSSEFTEGTPIGTEINDDDYTHGGLYQARQTAPVNIILSTQKVQESVNPAFTQALINSGFDHNVNADLLYKGYTDNLSPEEIVAMDLKQSNMLDYYVANDGSGHIFLRKNPSAPDPINTPEAGIQMDQFYGERVKALKTAIVEFEREGYDGRGLYQSISNNRLFQPVDSISGVNDVPEERYKYLTRPIILPVGATKTDINAAKEHTSAKNSGSAATFPEALVKEKIELLAKPDDIVYDPFVGSGTTIRAASSMNRDSLGVELNPDNINLAAKLGTDKSKIINADSVNTDIGQELQGKQLGLTITSPPYMDIKDYGSGTAEVGKDKASYFDQLAKVFQNVYDNTRDGGWLVVNTRDIVKLGQGFSVKNINEITSPLASRLEAMGWKLEMGQLWKTFNLRDNTIRKANPDEASAYEHILTFRKVGNENTDWLDSSQEPLYSKRKVVMPSADEIRAQEFDRQAKESSDAQRSFDPNSTPVAQDKSFWMKRYTATKPENFQNKQSYFEEQIRNVANFFQWGKSQQELDALGISSYTPTQAADSMSKIARVMAEGWGAANGLPPEMWYDFYIKRIAMEDITKLKPSGLAMKGVPNPTEGKPEWASPSEWNPDSGRVMPGIPTIVRGSGRIDEQVKSLINGSGLVPENLLERFPQAKSESEISTYGLISSVFSHNNEATLRDIAHKFGVPDHIVDSTFGKKADLSIGDIDKVTPLVGDMNSAITESILEARKVNRGPEISLNSTDANQILGETLWKDRQAILKFYKGSDLTTGLHELGHVWRGALSGKDLGAITSWAFQNNNDDPNQWWKLSGDFTPEQEKAEERFAEAFTNWALRGTKPKGIPKETLAGFESVRKTLETMFEASKGIIPGTEFSPEMRNIMNGIVRGRAATMDPKDRAAYVNMLDKKQVPKYISPTNLNAHQLDFDKKTVDELASHFTAGLGDDPRELLSKQELFDRAAVLVQDPDYMAQLDLEGRKPIYERRYSEQDAAVAMYLVQQESKQLMASIQENPNNFKNIVDSFVNDNKVILDLAQSTGHHAGMSLGLRNLKESIAASKGLAALQQLAEGGKLDSASAAIKRAIQKKDWSAVEALAQDPRYTDCLGQIMYSSLLSNPGAWGSNLGGNVLWSLFQVPHRAIAATIDAIMLKTPQSQLWDRFYYGKNVARQRQFFLGEILPMLTGLKTGFKAGAIGAWKGTGLRELPIVNKFVNPPEDVSLPYMGSDKVYMEVHKRESTAFERVAIPGSDTNQTMMNLQNFIQGFNPILNIGTDIMIATDLPFRAAAWNAEVRQIGYRKARNQGMSHDAAFAYSETYEPTPKEQMQAADAARYSVFSDLPGKLTKSLNAIREQHPVAKPFTIPFLNTLVNIAKRGAEMIPGIGLGVEYMEGQERGMREAARIARDYNSNLTDANSKRMTIKEAYDQMSVSDRFGYGHSPADIIAKQVEGALLAGLASMFFDKDKITGPLPQDPVERAAFIREGKQPDSISLGGNWYSFDKMDPISKLLKVVALMKDEEKMVQKGKENPLRYHMEDRLAEAGWAVLGEITNSGFFGNLGTYLNDKPGNKELRQAVNIFTNVIPFSGLNRWLGKELNMIHNDGKYIPPQVEGVIASALYPTLFQAYEEATGAKLGFIDRMPSVNVWGEKKSVGVESTFLNWLPPHISPDVRIPMEDYLANIGYYPQMPQKVFNLGGRTYNYDKQAYLNLLIASGEQMRKYVDTMSKNEKFTSLPVEMQVRILNDGIGRIRRPWERKAQGDSLRAGMLPLPYSYLAGDTTIQ